jgi:hypothetical protein
VPGHLVCLIENPTGIDDKIFAEQCQSCSRSGTLEQAHAQFFLNLLDALLTIGCRTLNSFAAALKLPLRAAAMI